MGITQPIGDADARRRSTTHTMSNRRRVVVTA